MTLEKIIVFFLKQEKVVIAFLGASGIISIFSRAYITIGEIHQ